MDMTSFVVGYARSKRKGASSGDAVKVGILGSVVGEGNPGLGIVASEKASERYVPAATKAAPVPAPGDGGGGEPDWVKDLKKEIADLGKAIAELDAKAESARAELKQRIETLESYHKPTGAKSSPG